MLSTQVAIHNRCIPMSTMRAAFGNCLSHLGLLKINVRSYYIMDIVVCTYYYTLNYNVMTLNQIRDDSCETKLD